jgi:Uma2 family endonuclease
MVLAEKKKKALKRLYTVAEFETLPEVEERYELIDGRLVEKPMSAHPHGRIVQRLNRAITLFDPEEALGEIAQEVSTQLDKKNAPLPDLSFWKAERKPTLSEKTAPRPDLAVEVLSPHDLASKKRLEEVRSKIRKYQAVGVTLIWVINPKEKIVEVYHTGQVEPLTLGVDDQLEAEDVIPGFKMPVVDLFR